jgi:hypothetical protein
MSVTTVIDEDRCEALATEHGLKVAGLGSRRGVAQRACLMNLQGTPDDRIDAIVAQREWSEWWKSEAAARREAKRFHNWLIDENFLPKDTAQAGMRVRGQTRALDEDEVFRLLDFARNEASIKGKRRQVKGQTETMAMRVVGNWCVIGRDADSAKLKALNPYMSRRAWELRKTLPLEDWVKGKNTANDHWEPLDHLWAWMINDKPNRNDLLDRIKKWPIVTVTKSEHDDLNTWNDCPPAERYGDRVEVGRRVDDDKWMPLELPL